MAKNIYDDIFANFKKNDEDIQDFKRILGRGAFGEVREVLICGKIYAAKLVKKEKSDNIEPDRLRGSNIIKIVKISERQIGDKYYDLIVMEKAVLKDIGTLISFLNERNLLKLIYNPFNNSYENNLLRFFARQIIIGLETLDRNEFVHFDIKPENLLVTSGLILKISDFSFLKNLRNDEGKFKIPGGTHGYVSPEYYKREKIDGNEAKKQDYFALGATLYFIKFYHRLLKYKKYDDDKMNQTRVIDLLQRNISLIRSDLLLEKDFIEFICSLISYSPQHRPTFEEIYRNKWLYKNKNLISDINHTFTEGDEDKLLRELLKSDFLIVKKNEYKNRNIPKFKFLRKKKLKKIIN